MIRRTKIVVAMSGGVDSSVAAALLKEQGYEVIGVMLRLWSEPGKEESNRCCTPESVVLARRAAAQLDIPFYVLDAKDGFRATVVQTFIDGYCRGETPNPCLECNRKIRWTFLLEHALALGADLMATGHYAQLDHDPTGKVRLLRAADLSKDQSYVLHVLNQDQLRRTVFPLGVYAKTEVRSLASRHGLPMATRHDSQDLCFLAGGDYRDFLRRHGPQILIPGLIVDTAGGALGEHNGLANYTIGQRKGLHVPSPVPLYVIRKEVRENRLVVGEQRELGTTSLMTGEVSWLAGEPMPEPFRAQVKTRYTAAERPAVVTPLEGGRRVRIEFDEKQRDVTPGQAAVFYVENVVLGGGIIQ
jgi:tRNA-specific 2-thiouridylase